MSVLSDSKFEFVTSRICGPRLLWTFSVLDDSTQLLKAKFTFSLIRLALTAKTETTERDVLTSICSFVTENKEKLDQDY